MECKIFYGMSGSLKLTTINALYSEDFKVYSDTKAFYDMDRDYFNWSSRPNDAHLAIHRILTLSLPDYLPKDRNISIERGVTDNLFCVPTRKIDGLSKYSDINIKELVKLELDVIARRSGASVRKILMIMEDKDFIINKVLTEPHRCALYPDINSYMRKQEEYVNFTLKHNDISETISIPDANYYITEVLKLNLE